ncbi:MAG: hypothetical protein H7Y86_16980 [Rhizobacter sp.]|nr:hypothetical protein [Ferruginibacter sp.]
MKKFFLPLLLLSSVLFFSEAFSQNTGIGTITPQFKLSVHDATHGYIKFSNNTTTEGNTNGSFIGAFTNDLYIWNKQPNGNQFFYTDGTRRLTLDSLGRFGIGKWPEETFDVKGDMRLESSNNTTGSILRMYGGATGTSVISFYKDINTPTLGASIGYSPAADYAYISNGTAAYFTPAGMGISTSTPLAKVQIVNGQDAGLSASSNGFLMLGSGNAGNVVMDNNEILARNNNAASDLFVQHSGGNLILCGNEAGAVGIGVASGANIPTGYLFAVDGKMISEELKVQLSGNWPDYVFKDDYKLKSFDQLRAFIKEKNHLPNIPPAAEVEKNGIEVGDMQKRMVEKIEELTLYILELENRLKKLEENNHKNTIEK